MEGEPPFSLTDLPCDHWEVVEGPEVGSQALLCIDCGWYRIIPNEDAEAARKLHEAIYMLFGKQSA